MAEIIYIGCTCPFCGAYHEIAVSIADYLAWYNGTHAQDAFPYLSADERELLMSGFCHKCWDKMFGEIE